MSQDNKPEPSIVETWEVHTFGWDIPTKVLLDSNGDVWVDSAHGSDGFKGKDNVGHYTRFVRNNEYYEEYRTVTSSLRKRFNMKPKLPDWMDIALRSGWTPPEGFDLDKYER